MYVYNIRKYEKNIPTLHSTLYHKEDFGDEEFIKMCTEAYNHAIEGNDFELSGDNKLHYGEYTHIEVVSYLIMKYDFIIPEFDHKCVFDMVSNKIISV